MSKVLTIAKKELGAYFHSPIAYIVMVVSLSVFNVLFYLIIDQNREAVLRDMFLLMEFLFVFLVPILTMRVFAEEKMMGTMEFLQTTPTTNTQIVCGKYLSSLAFFTGLLLLTLPYYIILEIFSAPDVPAIVTGYLGVWLEGALFIAIGVFTSSLSRNQIIAAIAAYALIFFLYFSVGLEKFAQGTGLHALQYLGVMNHSKNLFIGLITTSDLIYFASGIFLFITLTRITVENRLCR
jgi:ABC-2 type transport system permease protein